MRILITGGSGFIGSNVAQHLLEKKNEITILDRKEGALNCRYVKGDITDERAVAISMEGQEAVIHLAAQVSAPQSIEAPDETRRINVGGSERVLAAAKVAGVKKVILASSAAVYGETPKTPTREDEPLNPMSPYAESKIEMEKRAAHYAKEGLPTICLRFFNVYGPGQDPTSQYAAVVPAFITRALRGRPLTLYGNGEQTRDFIYVEDVARAIELALKKGSGEINIATGTAITIKELAEKIVALTDSKSTIVKATARPGDPKTSLADVSRAEEELGFTSTQELEASLRHCIDWFSANES